jgi:hypothetical protein
MELCGQLHALASLPLRKVPAVTLYGKLGQIQSRVVNDVEKLNLLSLQRLSVPCLHYTRN